MRTYQSDPSSGVSRNGWVRVLFFWVGLPVFFLLSGCVTGTLSSARQDFYAGRAVEAEEKLATLRTTENDRVLMLMERGTVRQALGRFDDSTRDFIEAADLLEELRVYSLSQGAGSLVISDEVQSFRGMPFERTLVHVLAAINHLAVGHWENAAVEARRILRSLTEDMRGEYPDDAFSRYVAGYALEMFGDGSNAQLQYRLANELIPAVQIDHATGRLQAAGTNTLAVGDAADPYPAELLCIVMTGRSPRGSDVLTHPDGSGAVYAELFVGPKYLGRSYVLSDTLDLAFSSEQVAAARKALKTITRIVIKESIAQAIEQHNEALGDLVRFFLIGILEQPDQRRWETLPRWLSVARVACPPDLEAFEMVLKNRHGGIEGRLRIPAPMARRGSRMFMFVRDTGVRMEAAPP